MAKVFIGVDPHKLSATIEVVDNRETVLATGRFGTDKAGYAAMRKHVASYPDRVSAVEGSNGTGRPLAQRLLADGELSLHRHQKRKSDVSKLCFWCLKETIDHVNHD